MSLLRATLGALFLVLCVTGCTTVPQADGGSSGTDAGPIGADAGACSCAGRVCGDDGCGASCGTCAVGSGCVSGRCSTCGDCTGRECGDDGCGGSCGNCGSGSCVAGSCVSTCSPDCSGRECGPDPRCGESCGTCSSGSSCSGGTCRSSCAPSCGGRTCGPDGCGGVCGTCGSSQMCISNNCVTCGCGGRECGTDACGTSCGTCASGETCSGSGACTCPSSVSCYPDVDGDGYPANVTPTVYCATSCPSGTMLRRPDGRTDCHDSNGMVNPGVTAWHDTSYCRAGIPRCSPSFDYDCDGTGEQRWPSRLSCLVGVPGGCGNEGWNSSTIPACGQYGFWGACDSRCMYPRLYVSIRQECR